VKNLARFILALAVCVIGLAPKSSSVIAHEVRPAVLEITQENDGILDVKFKIPLYKGQRVDLKIEFPSEMKLIGNRVISSAPGAQIEKSAYRAGVDDIVGKPISIEGFGGLQVDVLVRVAFANGFSHSDIVRPQDPIFVIPNLHSKFAVATSYWRLGVEHILEGFDHLLFVFALILIVPNIWLLVKTITAFTVAHSITLGLAALGFVNLPPGPTETVIAFSIVFLAVEIVRLYRGKEVLSATHPWVVAGLFGLVHELGFAGALSQLGLPAHEIPLALLAFNLGVETGQLLFVVVTVPVLALARHYIVVPIPGRLILPYAIGAISSFWVIERLLGFVA
jgi:hypothetical protein